MKYSCALKVIEDVRDAETFFVISRGCETKTIEVVGVYLLFKSYANTFSTYLY